MAALPAWPPAASRLKSFERSFLPVILHPVGKFSKGKGSKPGGLCVLVIPNFKFPICLGFRYSDFGFQLGGQRHNRKCTYGQAIAAPPAYQENCKVQSEGVRSMFSGKDLG